jgi:hypothetical protein
MCSLDTTQTTQWWAAFLHGQQVVSMSSVFVQCLSVSVTTCVTCHKSQASCTRVCRMSVLVSSSVYMGRVRVIVYSVQYSKYVCHHHRGDSCLLRVSLTRCYYYDERVRRGHDDLSTVRPHCLPRSHALLDYLFIMSILLNI